MAGEGVESLVSAVAGAVWRDRTVNYQGLNLSLCATCAGKLVEMVAESSERHEREDRANVGVSIVARLRENGTTRPDGSKEENG